MVILPSDGFYGTHNLFKLYPLSLRRRNQLESSALSMSPSLSVCYVRDDTGQRRDNGSAFEDSGITNGRRKFPR